MRYRPRRIRSAPIRDSVDGDVLIGGPGIDTIDGGAGNDIILQGENVTDGVVAGSEWLAAHAHVRNGRTVLDLDARSVTVPEADLV
jgi:RTX calcium-binding nonapeptide repeat (4 copies)